MQWWRTLSLAAHYMGPRRAMRCFAGIGLQCWRLYRRSKVWSHFCCLALQFASLALFALYLVDWGSCSCNSWRGAPLCSPLISTPSETAVTPSTLWSSWASTWPNITRVNFGSQFSRVPIVEDRLRFARIGKLPCLQSVLHEYQKLILLFPALWAFLDS